MSTEKYNASSITVLEGLEAVRKLPGMYIGSTNSRGLHHLVWEILDNAVDEHMAGACQNIWITLHKDGSMAIEDDGRGVPVDMHEKGVSAERIIYTVLHAGGKFANNAYKVAGGLHGVGGSVVNALSEWFEVEVYQDGKIYRDRYELGANPVVKLVNGLLPIVGKTKKRGTKVSFKPDATIFETVEFRIDIIKKRIKELSYLNKGLRFYVTDEQVESYEEFYEEDGIVGFIKDSNKMFEPIHDKIISLSGKSGDITVNIAFQYKNDSTETIFSFCNNISTHEGGTHISGFKTALTRIINQYAKELGVFKNKKDTFEGRDVRMGITAVISILHPAPQYEGQTKTKLGSTDAKGAVDEVFATESQKFFDRNLETLKIIIENAMKSMGLRKVEEKAKSNFLGKNSAFMISSKLVSCQSKNPEETEIFLVEGDSAGGSVKQGRDRKIQALLPLRGKVLNVEKVLSPEKVLDNAEIRSMIKAFGCGFSEGTEDGFNINKLLYRKIIILTDADIDGAHIRILLLTFFHRFMPELIYEGVVYIGVPPLYKVMVGKKVEYLYSDRELEEARKRYKDKKIELQRYKGLGEMNPEQLWETTLNPQTRLIKQVTIEDTMLADEITNVLMGKKVEPRREFIYQEAKKANLDL